jgi:hypothetical protein
MSLGDSNGCGTQEPIQRTQNKPRSETRAGNAGDRSRRSNAPSAEPSPESQPHHPRPRQPRPTRLRSPEPIPLLRLPSCSARRSLHWRDWRPASKNWSGGGKEVKRNQQNTEMRREARSRALRSIVNDQRARIGRRAMWRPKSPSARGRGYTRLPAVVGKDGQTKSSVHSGRAQRIISQSATRTTLKEKGCRSLKAQGTRVGWGGRAAARGRGRDGPEIEECV